MNAKIEAPFGVLGITVREGRLAEIAFLPHGESLLIPRDPLSIEVCRQIESYLSDPDFEFDLPLMPEGTLFQKKVWNEISGIPKGKTLEYGEIAKTLSSSPRAVGQACGSNPIPIVIPCHRVVSRSGLGGFMHHSDGNPISVKKWLLAHESD
ncbi:MAG TPA: methylated-DNA--[protein]-cysteine S-methyltransferase [Burkholderiales bacterium]|nr:methylated-DNA--[protein]-cysteine S-methyltransferase [Burkholderiales bacterium]